VTWLALACNGSTADDVARSLRFECAICQSTCLQSQSAFAFHHVQIPGGDVAGIVEESDASSKVQWCYVYAFTAKLALLNALSNCKSAHTVALSMARLGPNAGLSHHVGAMTA
jgi:hypothetical protein